MKIRIRISIIVAPLMVSKTEDERDHPRRSNHATTGANRYASAREQSIGIRMMRAPMITATQQTRASKAKGTHLIHSSGFRAFRGSSLEFDSFTCYRLPDLRSSTC